VNRNHLLTSLNQWWNIVLFCSLGLTNIVHAIDQFNDAPTTHGSVIVLTLIYVLLGTYGINWMSKRPELSLYTLGSYFVIQGVIISLVHLIIANYLNLWNTPSHAWGIYVHGAVLSLRGRVFVWTLLTTSIIFINAPYYPGLPHVFDEVFVLGIFALLGHVLVTQFELRDQISGLLDEARKQRQREKEAYEQLTEIQQVFFSNVTHDMKNPLSGLTGYAELLSEQSVIKEDSKLSRYVKNIERSTTKLSDLIQDILTLTQMEIQSNDTPDDIDIDVFLKQSIHDIEQQAQERNIQLHYSGLGETKILVMSEYRLQRVIDNLLSNAIKYSEDGGQIWLSASYGMKHLTITLRDEGLGIPETALPHLFDTFYRAHNKDYREISGTGLGLTIVKNIIEQQGGQVSAKNNPTKGSTFTITLPLQQQTSPSNMLT